MSNIIKYNSTAVEQFKQDKPLLIKHPKFWDALRSTQISILHRNDKKLCEAVIVKVFQELNLLLNAEFSVEQIRFLAASIITEYWYLRIDEVPYVLKRGILGDWGKLYGKPNVATVMEWFRQYDIERTRYFEDKNIMESQKYKEFRYTSAQLIELEERLNKLKKLKL